MHLAFVFCFIQSSTKSLSAVLQCLCAKKGHADRRREQSNRQTAELINVMLLFSLSCHIMVKRQEVFLKAELQEFSHFV